MNPSSQDPMVAQMKNYLQTQGIQPVQPGQQGDWYSQFQQKYQSGGPTNDTAPDTSLMAKIKSGIGGAAKGLGAELPLEAIDTVGRGAVNMFGNQQMKDNLANAEPLDQKYEDMMKMNDNPTEAGAGQTAGTAGGVIGAFPETAAALSTKVPQILKAAGELKPITALKDLATPLENRVQTLLNNTNPEQAQGIADTLKRYVQVAKDSVSGNSATPYEVVGKEDFANALANVKQQMSDTGAKIGEHLTTYGNTKLDPETITNIVNNARQDAKNVLGVDPLGANPANRIPKIVTAEGRKLYEALQNSLLDVKSSNSVQQIDDLLGNLNQQLQASAGTGFKPLSNPVQKVVKTFANELSNAQKSTIDSLVPEGEQTFSQAKSQYADLRDLYERLNSKLGENGKQAASMIKQIFSPTNDTRSLVEELQNVTGHPLFDKANLAHFAMKIAGDPRVESLLEKGTSLAKGAQDISKFKLNEPGTWLKFITDTLQDPEGKALRILEKKGAFVK